ncbi:hypothetical protein RND71_018191 [Anisodus tanguticus]|uniref:Uncharacterized protein n=1 Tax=Anisodus tanguticus TaxID=243964 RepID=A0AAE1VJY0_9SOLA|nr:hypothetical protein RND71_018191 [Anisodus tanguticus]
MDKAKGILWRIHKNGVVAELWDLADSIERECKVKWKRLSCSSLLVLNIVFQILQRFVGLDSILFLGPMLLQSIGYFYHASFLALLIASVVCTGVVAYTFFGRRRTLIFTCVGMFLAHAVFHFFSWLDFS